MSYKDIAVQIALFDPTDGDLEPVGESLLDIVADWLGTFIKTAQPDDLYMLTLWAVHTHVVRETYTTPRLLIDSAAPGSGKTTVLDHLKQLCFDPVQAASLSSPALLTRMLQHEPRTVLIDEADRTLDPKAEGTGELLAVLNSGYRFGASRPVLEQQKIEGVTKWVDVEMSTYGAVAMAGNAPNLPDDTRSRCIRVLLLPDLEGTVEDSDWELIEPDAKQLHTHIAAWANRVREQIASGREFKETLNAEGLKGRNRERWSPLYRVAFTTGDKWAERCLQLIRDDLEQQEDDRDNGLLHTKRHVRLLQDIASVWPAEDTFLPTDRLLVLLHAENPEYWGLLNEHKALTAQGLGRMLVKSFNIRTDRKTTGERERGYQRSTFEQAFKSFGLKVD